MRLSLAALAVGLLLSCSREKTSPPAPAPAHRLAGTWLETFAGREGCSDRISIEQAQGALKVAGADCNDGHTYVFEPPTLQGQTLEVSLTVPETGFVVRYTLSPAGPDELKGHSEVTGRGETHRYEVTWRRQAR